MKETSKWNDGGEYKILLHGLVGGITSQISGNSFFAGSTTTGLNELLQTELGKIKDANLHQLASSIISEGTFMN